MVTPELLDRFPIFRFFGPEKRAALAAISKEESYPAGTIIYREREDTDYLYILMDGSVELLFKIEADNPDPKELPFGLAGAGEMFGLSALLEPHVHTSTARTTSPSRVIKIQAKGLMALYEQDLLLAYQTMRQVAQTTARRLNTSRRQLAKAYLTSMKPEVTRR